MYRSTRLFTGERIKRCSRREHLKQQFWQWKHLLSAVNDPSATHDSEVWRLLQKAVSDIFDSVRKPSSYDLSNIFRKPTGLRRFQASYGYQTAIKKIPQLGTKNDTFQTDLTRLTIWHLCITNIRYTYTYSTRAVILNKFSSPARHWWTARPDGDNDSSSALAVSATHCSPVS